MSSTFKDKKDRSWTFDITVDTIKRVRQFCDVDLMEVGGANFLENVVADEIKMVNMFFIILEDQAKEQNISDEDFGKALAGDEIDDASLAFMEGLTNFFRPSKREAAKKLLAKTNQIADEMFKKAGLEADQIDPEKEVTKYIESMKDSTKQ